MKNAKEREQIMRIVEIVIILVLVASSIWTVTTTASLDSLENPVSDPRVNRAIMVTTFAASLWLVLLVMREAEQFGWRQALFSTFFVIAGQVILFVVLRLLR